MFNLIQQNKKWPCTKASALFLWISVFLRDLNTEFSTKGRAWYLYKEVSCQIQTSKPDKKANLLYRLLNDWKESSKSRQTQFICDFQEQKCNSKTLQINTKTKIRLTLLNMRHKIPKRFSGSLAQRFLQCIAETYVFDECVDLSI